MPPPRVKNSSITTSISMSICASRALAKVIVQIEQLIARKFGRAQIGFDLFFITRELEAARCVGKIVI